MWITRSLNPVGPLVMTICVLYLGTGAVLQVSRDSANPIENGLSVRIDHKEESYELWVIMNNVLTIYSA